MADLRPFRALRPGPGLAGEVIAPPYDVVDVDQGRAIAAGRPRCFLHVTRPEIDLPDGTDPHTDAVHARARAALDRMIVDETLVLDAQPGYTVYRQHAGRTVQTGVVGCASVADYRRGVIATHEHTRPDKEDDRTRHLAALDAHDEPVFLMAPRSPAVDEVVDRVTQRPPQLDLTGHDGVRHVLWQVTSAREVTGLQAAFTAVERLYVADGHHRSAAAARLHDRRAGSPGAHDAFPVVVFPVDELTVLPYHRVLLDLPPGTVAELLRAASGAFTVEATPVAPTLRAHEFGFRSDTGWHRLTLHDHLGAALDVGGDPVARLDVAVLQDRLLGPLLDLTDPRTDPRIGFVGGTRGTAELDRLVRTGEVTAAVALHPNTAADVLRVADAGLVMPPKSTWFEPKLASGLFVHPCHPSWRGASGAA